MGLVALAKLNKSEIDFASSYGTMPPCGVVAFEAIGLARSRGGKWLCKSKLLYPRQAKLTNRWMLIRCQLGSPLRAELGLTTD